MSTILKALRKLEQDRETPSSGEGHGAAARQFNARSTVMRAVRGAWGARVGLKWIGIVVAILLGGSGVTLYYAATHHTHQKRAVSVHPPMPDGTRALNNNNGQPRDSRPVVFQEQRIGPARAALQAERAFESNVSGLDEGAADMPPQPLKKNAPPEDHAAAQSSLILEDVTQAEKPLTVESKSVAMDTRPEKNRYADARRLSNDRITVQAIVWAPDPKDRMAMINDQVIREGRVVEGMRIVSIESDMIVLQENGDLFFVKFKQP